MFVFRQHKDAESIAIAELFTAVFTESEDAAAGQLIGRLAGDLLADVGREPIYCFVAEAEAQLVGAIFFSRLSFPGQPNVFILAPVAVATSHQGKGIGQQLIGHGLDALRARGAQVALTYGDPAFYAKVGFQAIAPALVPPPFTLTQPEGWLGQSLDGMPVPPLQAPSTCVQALNNPAYW